MGAFKLDLMTLLVIFVVISVVLTMTAGPKEKQHPIPNSTVEKPLVQGFGNVNSATVSRTGFRGTSARISQPGIVGKTWN